MRANRVAEGVGFEPTIRLPVYTLSKRAPSATRPSLLVAGVGANIKGEHRLASATRSAIRYDAGAANDGCVGAIMGDTKWAFCVFLPASYCSSPSLQPFMMAPARSNAREPNLP